MRRFLAGALCASMIFGVCVTTGAQETGEKETGEKETEVKVITSQIEEKPTNYLLNEPVYDESKDTYTYSYVYYGSYPQSEVTGDALTEEIKDAEYVSGEAVIDGVKYRRMKKEDAYDAYDSDERYYAWDDAYHYFRYEPVLWRVLDIDGTQAFLWSDKILDVRQFCEGQHNDALCCFINCSMRTWLNDEFLHRMFSEEELVGLGDSRYCGAVKVFDSFGNGEKDEYEYHEDKVILHEYCDYKDVKGLIRGTEENCSLTVSDYAYANGLMKNPGERTGDWWTRKMTDNYPFLCYFNHKGTYMYEEWYHNCNGERLEYPAAACSQKLGVVPGVTVNLSKTDCWMTVEEMQEYQQDAPQYEANRDKYRQEKELFLEKWAQKEQKEKEEQEEAERLEREKYKTEGAYYYKLEDGQVKILEYLDDEKDEEVLEIPQQLGGYPVTAIGESAFRKCRAQCVRVPEGVQEIEFGAFCGSEIRILVIPKSMQEMQLGAGNGKLEKIYFLGDKPSWMRLHKMEEQVLTVCYQKGTNGWEKFQWGDFQRKELEKLFLTGDIDENGKVELQDAQLALKAALKIGNLDVVQKMAADVDENEKIELADAQSILKVALKISSDFMKMESE